MLGFCMSTRSIPWMRNCRIFFHEMNSLRTGGRKRLAKDKQEKQNQKPEITQEIKDALKNLGFTEYYINIYLTLLLNKELDARELSEKASVPYSRIY